jgi:hypothetical protein
MVRDGVARTVLPALFAAYVVATAVHLGLVMLHEPFAFDAWNLALDTRGEPFTWARFLDYGRFEYSHSNPRLGQWLTYLAYKLEYFAPIATPIAYLGLAGAVTVLGLGRWPGARHEGRRTLGRDLALATLAIGSLWFAIPRIGMIMFCRAYGANYLYGATIQLWFLVVLRLGPDAAVRWRARIGYAALGVVAGMCNEHTGPALLVGLAGYAYHRRRVTGARPQLAWAGGLGAAAGFAAIFFAPGQASRYDGLATKVSLVGRLLQRGVINNLEIFRDWVVACAPVLGLVVIALVIARDDPPATPGSRSPRSPLAVLGAALLAGTLITATVFVSPKLGPRFFLHGCALVLAGFLAVADRALITTRRLAPFVVLAVAASVYAGVRSLPLYYRLSEQGADRLAALAATPRGAVFTAEAFEQVDDSWWFLGDDFRDVKKRDLVAAYYDLRGVIFRGVDLEAPLGVSDVRLIPRYQVSPAGCLDAHGGLQLGTYRGIDITSVHKAMLAAVEGLRDQLSRATPPGRLDALDLVVGFTGAPPPLPRPTLVVGRWRPTGFERYAAVIERKGVSRTRTIKLPRELIGQDVEIYIYQVNGEARRLGTGRDPGLEYLPWKRGAYWALACRPSECFVIAAARAI